MIPYYIAFLLSIILCIKGEEQLRKGLIYKNAMIEPNSNRTHKISVGIKASHFYFALAVLIVALLAGMRGDTVGTDVRVYGNDLFYYSRTVSLERFISNLPQIETFYLIMVKFSSLIFSEPHFQYFLIGLIIYSFTMASFVKLSEIIPVTFSWMCYLFLMYGDSLNAMRQSIGIAIGLWAFCYFYEKKYIKSLIWLFIAFEFHSSAILYIAIAGILLILKKNNKWWVKISLSTAAVVGVYFFNTFFNALLTSFMTWGILDIKMSRYLVSESTGLSILAILIRIPFLALIIIQSNLFCNGRNKNIKPLHGDYEKDFWIIMLLTEMFTVELSAFVASLYRISLFFVPLRCMAYGRIWAVQSTKNRKIIGIALILYLLIIFIYQNQVKGNNEIYPYVFGIF